MRPRHEASENVRTVADLAGWAEASMRPRHEASENTGTVTRPATAVALQ